MFANAGLGGDGRAIACDLFIIAREAVSGLANLQQHLVATGILDDIVAVDGLHRLRRGMRASVQTSADKALSTRPGGRLTRGQDLITARELICASDLPDVSNFFGAARGLSCYFAWGCFRYFDWERDRRRLAAVFDGVAA